MALKLTSPAFRNQGEIPAVYTCDGKDISPALAWSNVPGGTRSLALIADDPDAPDPSAPKMTWVHWVLYNLPPTLDGLPEAAGSAKSPIGALAGVNDWKRTGYGGPCPPIGRHRYFFKLYALDRILPDLNRPTKAKLEAAMKAHVLAQTTLIGTYSARVEVSALGGPAFTFNVIRELEKTGRLSEGNFESLACASRTGNREYSMVWIIMADVVAALHAAYIVFVVAGFAAILAGSAARWQCVQNIYFRITHLAMMLVVCLGVTLGTTCQLTRLENALRLKGGQTGYARDFIGYWFDRIIFHDASPWVFATAYFTFGALVSLACPPLGTTGEVGLTSSARVKCCARLRLDPSRRQRHGSRALK